MGDAAARRMAMAGMATVALLGSSACGSVADKASEKATEKVTEEVTGAEDVDISEDGLSFETEDGSMSLGSGELPEDWPDDLLPIPDDAEDLVANTIAEGEATSLSVSFTTSEGVEDVVADYGEGLTDAGWEEMSTMTSSEFANATYGADEDGNEVATVSASEGDRTQVNLSYMVGMG